MLQFNINVIVVIGCQEPERLTTSLTTWYSGSQLWSYGGYLGDRFMKNTTNIFSYIRLELKLTKYLKKGRVEIPILSLSV